MVTAGTLQDQELVPESKNLCLQNGVSSETISQRGKWVSMAWEGCTSRLCKCKDFNVYGLFGRDRP